MQIQASKKTWINLSFRFESPEGFWMFNFFLHSLSVKKTTAPFFRPGTPTFDVKAIMLAATNLATGRFPPTILISKVAFGHLDYLGREWGVQIHVKVPLRTWESFIYVTWAYENKMLFGRKRGEVLRISHHSPQWRDILDQESLLFRSKSHLWWALGLELEIWRL